VSDLDRLAVLILHGFEVGECSFGLGFDVEVVGDSAEFLGYEG